jgi:hypothetical protein
MTYSRYHGHTVRLLYGATLYRTAAYSSRDRYTDRDRDLDWGIDMDRNKDKDRDKMMDKYKDMDLITYTLIVSPSSQL